MAHIGLRTIVFQVLAGMALLYSIQWFSSLNSQSLPHQKTNKTKQKYQHVFGTCEPTPVCLGYFSIIMTKCHDQNNYKLKHLTWESLFKNVRVHHHYIEEHGSRQAWSWCVLNPQEKGDQWDAKEENHRWDIKKTDSWDWEVDNNYAEQVY